MKKKQFTKVWMLLIILIVASLASALVADYLSNSVSAEIEVSPSPNWVLWLKLDEGSGSVAEDSSSYNNDGVINGSSWVDEGEITALSFDGNDYVVVPHSKRLHITKNITIMGWIKANSFTQPATVAGKWRDINNSNFRSYLLTVASDSIQDPRTPRFYISRDGTGHPVAKGSALSLSQWYHLAGTYDGTNIMLYVNGVLTATNTLPGDQNLFLNKEPLLIGANDGYGGSARKFTNGIIDDVRIFNIALDADEIRAAYTKTCSKYGVC